MKRTGHLSIRVYEPVTRGDVWPLPYHAQGHWLLVLSEPAGDTVFFTTIPAWKAVALWATGLGRWYATRLMPDQFSPKRFAPKWTIWKVVLMHALNAVEWGDREYCRATLPLPYPFKAWITVYEPAARQSWHRRIMPYRIRLQLEGLIRSWVYRACTRCGARLRELLAQDGRLQYFQSGSICHRDCEPSEEFKRMAERARLRP